MTPSPAPGHIVQVQPDDERKLQPEEQSHAFQRSTVYLLFLSVRASPDILTPVSFLTKLVISQD